MNPGAVETFRAVRFGSALVLLAILLVAGGLPQLYQQLNLHSYFLLTDQDALVAPLFVFACFATVRARVAGRLERDHQRLETSLLLLCMVAAIAVCWAGHYLVFRDLDLTRDELMVRFDSGIFRDLSLAAPIPLEWRPMADALNRKFMLPIGSAEAWVSAYLPVNAAFHAAAGAIVDDDLTAPLFVAAGAFFLWRISLRLWPDDRGARVATIILYFTSAQIIVTGMTKYAMSAHMALNLAWLWLFLRNRPASHALAMLIGFLATGLHQPIFHPLFALPFVLLIAARREWRLFLAYGAAYTLIFAFWIGWPMMVSALGAGPVTPTASLHSASFLERLSGLFQGFNLEGFWLTCANLVRFITWQHPLWLLLACFGAWSFWRPDPLVRALVASVILPVLVLWVVLPWQGNGWGYRYLHPAIGSAILLGGWGWHALTQRGLTMRRHFIWGTAVAILLLLPLRALMVFQSTRQFAESERAIANLDADIAIIDGRDTEFVYNRHDLANRPIRLVGPDVPKADMARLCRGRRIVFVDGERPRPVSPWQQALKAEAAAAGCQTKTVVVWMGLLRRWRPSFNLG